MGKINGGEEKSMRAIDADALEVVTAKVPKGMDAKSYMAGMEYVLSQIDALPTIEERKTGKWIEFPNHTAYKCSECGRVIETTDGKRFVYKHFPFCHCGAKMEGEQP